MLKRSNIGSPKKKGVTKLSKKEANVVGWREWVSLPDLGAGHIKAKIDTGAKTSALHASDIKWLTKDKIKFTVWPHQDDHRNQYTAKAKVLGKRKVKSSTGSSTLRPVIQTTLKIGNHSFAIELTLVNRDMMGFRMLIGRQAMRNRFMVNPGKSFLMGKLKRRPKKTGSKKKPKSTKTNRLSK